MSRLMTKKERAVYNSYHLPGCSNLHKRKINAVFLNPANSLKHELEKLKVCYDLQKNGSKFISEAVRNKKDVNGKERRVDVVCLSSGKEFEIETTAKRAERFFGQKGVIVIKVWEEKNG